MNKKEKKLKIVKKISKAKSNTLTIKVFVFLLILLLASLYIKDRFKIKENVSSEPKQTIDRQIAPTTNTVKPTISPAPQDPNKPKLTDDFIQKISDQLSGDIFQFKPGNNSDILGYTEKDTSENHTGMVGKFTFSVESDHSTPNYPVDSNTTITIKDGNAEVFRKTYDFPPIGSFEIRTMNQITKIVQIFSYGAHCCVSLIPITEKNNKIYVGQPLDVRNTDIIAKEHFFVLNDKLYKIVYDDRFEYYDMSFAESGVMFYPMIYLIDEKGFTAVPHLYKDYYEKLYQSSRKELAKINTQLIDWEDIFKYDYIYGRKIYMYTLGYLAGHDRQELKAELLSNWSNLSFNEDEIFKMISEDASPSYQYAPVVYTAELKRFSTSGDMRFYWYDVAKKQRINPDDEYSWFFALPTKVPADEKATIDWVKFIEENKTAVFKITGTREPDDCGYYGLDHCVQSINIDKIEIVN